MKKIALLAGTCALFFFVACGDDSSTSASKNDSPNTAEIVPPKDSAQVDSGCTVKEADEGFDIICNGDSVDTIHDEETEQGTCHVKDTVNASGSAGVKITCGDSTRFVWTATNDKDDSSSSTKEEKVSSGKEDASSSAKNENISSGKDEKNSSSSQKESSEKSSSSIKSEVSSSSVKPGNSSSSAKPESSSVKEESSSSSSEENHSSSVLQAPVTITCNSQKITTDTAFCFRNRQTGKFAIYRLCGEAEYDPEVATCDGGTIKVECGGTAYDTLQKVCLNEALYPLTATEKGIEGVYIGANDTTYDSDTNIVSVKPIYFAKANLLLVKKGEGNYEGVVPASPGIISKGARVKYHNEMYYDIEADTLDLFVHGDTSGYFYLEEIINSSDIAGNEAYDIARAKLGGKWRLPRYDEIWHLYLYRYYDNHIDPIHKTEIALPKAGYYNETGFVNNSHGYRFDKTGSFVPSNFNTNGGAIRYGFAVRPVFTGD